MRVGRVRCRLLGIQPTEEETLGVDELPVHGLRQYVRCQGRQADVQCALADVHRRNAILVCDINTSGPISRISVSCFPTVKSTLFPLTYCRASMYLSTIRDVELIRSPVVLAKNGLLLNILVSEYEKITSQSPYNKSNI